MICWVKAQFPSIVAAGGSERLLVLRGGRRESDVIVHIRGRGAVRTDTMDNKGKVDSGHVVPSAAALCAVGGSSSYFFLSDRTFCFLAARASRSDAFIRYVFLGRGDELAPSPSPSDESSNSMSGSVMVASAAPAAISPSFALLSASFMSR